MDFDAAERDPSPGFSFTAGEKVLAEPYPAVR
jgi:hypothetical protein